MIIKLKNARDFILKSKKEIIFLTFFLILCCWVFITTIPKGFQPNTLFEIEEGESLKTVSQKLDDSGLIKSKTLFSILMILKGDDDNIVSGEYLFHNPESIFTIADRFSKGEYGISSITVTFPEGVTLNEMANILEDKFPDFNRKEFEIKTSLYEGYLFPDTYIFPENADVDLIIQTLISNFEDKMESIKNILKESGKDLREIIIMASIVEKEATENSRRQIANILWKRMEIEMPLQVDATFVYERGKGTFDLSREDLRTDSPYNTYTKAGLPPTPISNPGLESIKAAAQIEDTDYLFFLTGRDGEMYYAETHDEHVLNKQKYLN